MCAARSRSSWPARLRASSWRLDTDAVRRLVGDAVEGGLSRKDAVAQVVRDTGLPRREVYDAYHRSE